MPQRLGKCVKQLSTKIIIQAGTQQKTLQAFGPQMAEIVRIGHHKTRSTLAQC